MPTSEHRFQIIFNHSPVGMAVLDTGAHIQHVNESACAIFNRPETDLHGEALYRFLHEDEIDLFIEQFKDMVADGSYPLQTIVRVKNIDGTEPWCRLNCSYVSGVATSPFVFVLLEDVTEERRGQERLRREKEIAERATRTKSAFLANMSHEIRTPIHTVTGMTELLMETRLDPEQREYGEQIRFGAEVLLGLINDILDFSKIEAGKLSLEVIEFDLVKTIQEAVDLVSLEAHKKGLDVVIDIAPHIPQFFDGDPVRLRQVIVNLFNNAVKFTNTGEIVLEAREAPDLSRPAIVIRVIDTGTGIADDKLNRLFKPFSQVDSSTTRKFGGTGLGLSISRSLIELMNGSIGVQSREGQGSTFWFTVPFVDKGMRRFSVDKPNLNRLSAPRVLVVDDNRRTCEVIRSYLRAWGLDVETVQSGEEALKRLQQYKDREDNYDIVLIDAVLPGIDGWQLASEINALRNEAGRETRLILMTPAGVMGGEAKMKLLNWFDAYVNKPVKWADLARALDAAFIEVAPTVEDAEDADEIAELETLDPDDEPTAGETRDRPQDAEDSVSDVGKTACVLVAEDHFVNQQLFRTILEKTGCTVEVASDGQEALERASELNPDVVFMDIQMPRMNGYDAARAMRDAGLNMPIIAVTANAHSDERQRCLDYGMDDYMSKPFKPKDVRQLLTQWLGQHSSQEPRESSAADSGAADTVAVLNYTGAVESFMGKPDVLRRVMRSFLEKVQVQIDELTRLLEERNAVGIRSTAHSIKGGALSLEAVRLGQAASRLEDAAVQEQIDDCIALSAELGDEYRRLRSEWTTYDSEYEAV
ncbi:MAG: response regulator [Spirochaetaceae bacterium]|nr:MAG: response regulator [Spirochaetaceae bacterium]